MECAIVSAHSHDDVGDNRAGGSRACRCPTSRLERIRDPTLVGAASSAPEPARRAGGFSHLVAASFFTNHHHLIVVVIRAPVKPATEQVTLRSDRVE